MENINNKITLTKTELNLAQDPTKRQELNKKLNVQVLQKQKQELTKRIDQQKRA